eukprot:TRINITY_DN6032_c0_g3_i1.p1 TRINITY_DN6032_c0_g3~~TRINITY_DN6032_c0_g3_i1.p1  ORF type:complete len:467 (-),score=90.14 TRINITY_DN6032_c0_g3_i1:111-1511(-)
MNAIVHSGYLRKKSPKAWMGIGWQERFFVLEVHRLLYYKDRQAWADEEAPKMVIPLEMVSEIFVEDATSPTFQCKLSNGRVFDFEGLTLEISHLWLRMFAKIILPNGQPLKVVAPEEVVPRTAEPANAEPVVPALSLQKLAQQRLEQQRQDSDTGSETDEETESEDDEDDETLLQDRSYMTKLCLSHHNEHGYVIYSHVLQAYQDWADTSLLLAHEAIRHDLHSMTRVLKADGFPGTRQLHTFKIHNFFKWYQEWFLCLINHHQEAESNIYFPWILSKAPKRRMERVMAQDDLVKTALEGVSAVKNDFLAQLAPPPDGVALTAELEQQRDEEWARAGDRLRQRVQRLKYVMMLHLAREEMVLPGLLRDFFTPVEEAKVVGTILERYGDDLQKLVPWVAASYERWAGPQKGAEFITRFDANVREAYLAQWRQDYELHNVVLLESVSHPFNSYAAQQNRNCYRSCIIS